MKFTSFYSQGLGLLGLRMDRAGRVEKGLRDRAVRLWVRIDLDMTTINTITFSQKSCSQAVVVLYRGVTMGRFYLDMEFINGNYYLVDMLEMTLLVEES